MTARSDHRAGRLLTAGGLIATLALAACVAREPVRAVAVPGPAVVSLRVPNAGDAWAYQLVDGYSREVVTRFREEVVERTAEGARVRRTDLARGTHTDDIETGDGAWVEKTRLRMSGQRFVPPLAALPVPFEVGRTWQADATAYDSTAPRPFPVRIIGRVEGWERVQVPAGTFDAVRVRRTFYQYESNVAKGLTRIDEVAWYAPAVGNLVRYENRSGHENPSASPRGGTWVRGNWNIVELTAAGASAKDR